MKIGRDPFSRTDLERDTVEAHGKGCDWCGNHRKSDRLFVYSMNEDSIKPLHHQIRGKFCSISCMRSYHD